MDTNAIIPILLKYNSQVKASQQVDAFLATTLVPLLISYENIKKLESSCQHSILEKI